MRVVCVLSVCCSRAAPAPNPFIFLLDTLSWKSRKKEEESREENNVLDLDG